MQSRNFWIGAGLVAALVAAFVALRARQDASPPAPAAQSPRPAVAQAEAAPSPTPPRNLAHDLKVIPPDIRVQLEDKLRELGATGVQVAVLDPKMVRGNNNLQWFFTPPAAGAPGWQRAIWDKQMAPLIYPEGHPRRGQWRDSVSPEDVVAASGPMLERMVGPDYLDQKMLFVSQKRIDFDELNMARDRLWRRDDPSTARAFWEWLKNAPEDPNAYPSDFQLPAPPDDPDAISYRQWFEQEIARQAAEQMAAQRGRNPA